MKPDCYGCVHRRELWSGQSACRHPETELAHADRRGLVVALLGKRSPIHSLHVPAVVAAAIYLRVKPYPQHPGESPQRFDWPYSYDPDQLAECDGLTHRN